MRTLTTALLVAFLATTAWAQGVTDYLGPGILTRGAGSIGTRSGQDVDIRFFASASGTYTTGLTPISVSSDGKIPEVNGIFGYAAGLGAYGRHTWRRSVLGLDYNGNYQRYVNSDYYSGSNHQLALGYTLQKSRRLVFDFQTGASTSTFGNQFGYFGNQGLFDNVLDQNTLLFDNRVYTVQGGMDTNFILSSRTVFTAGGSTYSVRRQSSVLIGVNGYTIRGSLRHRLSELSTIGVSYQHVHYDYPRRFGESNIDTVQAQFARQFGRAWTLSVSGGAFQVETLGTQRVAVDPAIAALLGVTSTVQTYYRKTTIPSGSFALTHTWRNASWDLNYSRGFSPGNGVYLTSSSENIGTGFGYTGIRKWSFSVSANYNRLSSVAQQLNRYGAYGGSGSISYALTPVINLSTSYYVRVQDLSSNTFQRNSSTLSFGLFFSPGDIPISFH